MLYIWAADTVESTPISWHVGEPLPPMPARVVRFQADGDELQMILCAMQGRRTALSAKPFISSVYVYFSDGSKQEIKHT
jgi:hypothetical protein